jgi:hypothetical protein
MKQKGKHGKNGKKNKIRSKWYATLPGPVVG